MRNESQKLELYKRIAGIATEDDREEMQDELTDRFGDLPAAVEHLLDIALLRARANEARVTEIAQKGREIVLSMHPETRLQVEKLGDLLLAWNGALKVIPGAKPAFRLDLKKTGGKNMLNCVNSVINSLNELLEKER